MGATDVLQRDESLLMDSLVDLRKENKNCAGEAGVSRGLSIEKKIELLESLAGQVSNRRSRRLINDKLLLELVPRLNAEEIRGLFAPPPWGDEAPPSTFSMTDVGEWDKFRSIDMDKEAIIIDKLSRSAIRKKGHVDAEKLAVLNAWRRIDCNTREALRSSFLPELIEGYENCIQHFIEESTDGEVLELKVRDPFHRLLLHGVCEFYDLISVTVTETKGTESSKTTRIKRKKTGFAEFPSIRLSRFLKISKEGIW